MKLLYPFSGVAGIFFPVGKPEDGGTCEFASKKCLKECAAFKFATDTNKIPYETKTATYKFITSQPVFDVCSQIVKEMAELKSRILYWFAAGDCMRKHTGKIGRIILLLAEESIPQCGFTRNEVLWNTVRRRTNLVLTIENIQKAKKLGLNGKVAVPNYKTGEIYLFNSDYTPGDICNAPIFETTRLKAKPNCNSCYENKRGCFTFNKEGK